MAFYGDVVVLGRWRPTVRGERPDPVHVPGPSPRLGCPFSSLSVSHFFWSHSTFVLGLFENKV